MPDIGVRVRLLTEDGETAAHGLADALGVVDQKGKETQAQLDRVSAAAKTMGGAIPARELASAAIAAQKFGVEAATGSVKAERSAVQLKLKLDQVRASIEAARASGGPVDPRWTAAVARMDAEMQRNVATLGAHRRAAEDMRRTVQDATRAAGGLGGGLSSMSDIAGIASPRLERLAIQGGVVAGAIYTMNAAARQAVTSVMDMAGAVGAGSEDFERAKKEALRYTDALFSIGGAGKVVGMIEGDLLRATGATQKLAEAWNAARFTFELGWSNEWISTTMSALSPLLAAARFLSGLGGQTFGNVTGGHGTIGGVELAAQDRINQIARLNGELTKLDNQYRALQSSGKLTEEATARINSEYANTVKGLRELNAAVKPRHAAMAAEVKLTADQKRALEEQQRAAKQAADEERRRAEARRKAMQEFIADARRAAADEKLLYEAALKGAVAQAEMVKQLERRRNIDEGQEKGGAEGAALAAQREAYAAINDLLNEGNAARAEALELQLKFLDAVHASQVAIFEGLSASVSERAGEAFDIARRNTPQAQLDEEYIEHVKSLAAQFPVIHEKLMREITEIHEQRAREMVDRISAALSGMSELIGLLGRATGNSDRGGFQAAQQILGNVQGVISTYQNVSKLAASAGMSASAASSVGYVAAVFAVWAAIYEGVSAHIAKSKSKKFGAASQFEITGGAVGVTEVTEHAHAVNMALQQSIDALEEIFRGSVQQLEQIAIRVRNDGNRISAYVGETFVGYFSSIESAISASIAAALRTAELSSNVSPLIVAALRNTMAQTVEELAAQLGRVQEIADLGLDPVAIQIQRINMHFDELARTVTELRLGMQAAIDVENGRNAALLAARDQITGTVRSEREIRLAQMAAFNSEILARRAVILALIAELQARMAAMRPTLREGGAPGGGVGEGGDGDTGTGRRGRGGHKEFTGAGEPPPQPPAPPPVNPAYQALLDALAAAFAALAGLPALIAESEIQIRRAQGRQRREGREAIQAEAALFGLSDFAASLADTQNWLDEFKERIRTAGFSAAESARLVAEATEEAARRIAEAMAEQRARLIDPYLGGAAGSGASQFTEQLRQSKKDYEELREAGRDKTGIPDWQVNQAEANRNIQIGLEALSSLGIASANAAIEANGTAATLAFLRENMAALGLTAEEVAAAAQEVSTSKFLGYAERVARMLGDEALLAELAEARYDLEKAQMATEIEIMHARGVLLDAEYNRILGLIGRLPADLPVAGAGSEGRVSDYYQNLQKSMDDAAKAIKDAADRWAASTQKLIDFQKSFLLSDLSPLSPRQKLDEAQAQYDAVFAAARRGDVEARERFAEVAKALASESKSFYATSEGYTQGPATQIQRDLSMLIGQGGPYSIGNAVFGAFQSSSAPTVKAIEDKGTATVAAVDNVAAEISDLRNALAGNPGNAALEGKLDRLATAIESLVRRIA